MNSEPAQEHRSLPARLWAGVKAYVFDPAPRGFHRLSWVVLAAAICLVGSILLTGHTVGVFRSGLGLTPRPAGGWTSDPGSTLSPRIEVAARMVRERGILGVSRIKVAVELPAPRPGSPFPTQAEANAAALEWLGEALAAPDTPRLQRRLEARLALGQSPVTVHTLAGIAADVALTAAPSLFLFAAIVWLIRGREFRSWQRMDARYQTGLCPVCAYEARLAHGPICPECGYDIEKSAARARQALRLDEVVPGLAYHLGRRARKAALRAERARGLETRSAADASPNAPAGNDAGGGAA